MNKAKVAILGSGNIGTDLMIKLQRSPSLELVMVAGIDPQSEGLAMARERGIPTTSEGLDGLLKERPDVHIVFDATSAKAHLQHAPRLKEAGIKAIDLTPAAVGPYICPAVRLEGQLDEPNVNLITCGGQAAIPIVHAIHRVTPVHYAELVATISSRSAGPGTRQNIDEFTVTTARGLEQIGGAKKAKAIIILNPAEPPILMRDTIYALVDPEVDEAAVTASVEAVVQEVARYVPGYRLRSEPIFDEGKITVLLEVEGAGDYLPPYAGNLDIMTSAAVRVGEAMAQHLPSAS